MLKVLSGVDFKVNKGEKVGLIGEAGCGKTTTMKSIMRILPQNASIPSGEILFKDNDILKVNKKELQQIRRKKISMVFQDPTAALNPVFKIREQLFDIIKYGNESEEGKTPSDKEIIAEAIRVLKEVALPDPERILENYPFQLSGGMRQRVCIAMALVAANDLLIADEPGTSLDVTIEDQILRILGRLAIEKNLSVILISHALGAVRGLVDKVYVMYAGNIVEVAPTQELFSNPVHPYTRGLFRAIPKLTGGGLLEGIRGRIPNYMNPPEGCRFFPRCDTANSPCKSEKPELCDIGKDHQVACFKYRRK
jgi:peptide/nickel transport system ATP-binding protein